MTDRRNPPSGAVSSDDRPWWEVAFGDQYDTVYAHRSDTAAAAEVAGLMPRLSAAGGLVCDACCGNGRHLQAMKAAGLRAVGFDFSAHLLTTARQRPIAGRLARADIRLPPFLRGAFDAVTVLFTAFGYFDDASNAAALAGLASLLRPGGWLVLDLPDVDHLCSTLVPESRRTAPDGTLITERRRLDGTFVVKEVLLQRAGSDIGKWQERVRLYTDVELEQLTTVDFHTADRWSSLRGPTVDDSRRVHWLERREPKVS